MDKKEHIKRHKMLHKYLDELFADAITHASPPIRTKSSILELLEWSYKQMERTAIDHEDR